MLGIYADTQSTKLFDRSNASSPNPGGIVDAARVTTEGGASLRPTANRMGRDGDKAKVTFLGPGEIHSLTSSPISSY